MNGESKMSVDDYMYVWAFSYRHEKGRLTMHPFHMEGGKGTTSKVVKFQLRPDPLAK